MEVIDELCDLLQSHVNRDKVVGLTCYALKLWGSSSKKPHIMNASAKLASARACLRLFDDPATLKNVIKYGLGKQEGPLWGTIGIAGGVFTLAYLQAEKLIFLMDTGILTLPKDLDVNIRTAHKLLWSLFAFIGLIRSIRALHISAQVLKSPTRTKCAPARFTQATLSSTKLVLDVIHAVSWLPPGWLWGSALTTVHASGVATAAGVLGLVLHYHGKRLS